MGVLALLTLSYVAWNVVSRRLFSLRFRGFACKWEGNYMVKGLAAQKFGAAMTPLMEREGDTKVRIRGRRVSKKMRALTPQSRTLTH
jgi:hypothetical protein